MEDTTSKTNIEGIPTTNISLVHSTKEETLSIQSIPFQLSNGHHLIKISATALTRGELNWPEPCSLPYPVPGFDVAGTILNEVPNSPFKVGDRVYAGNETFRPGAARQYTEAKPEELALVPKKLTWEEVASMPLSALTAWQALFDHSGLKELDPTKDSPEPAKDEKKRILITAAAGGVGLWAVQFASLAGAYVVGTCGSGNLELVKNLGAHEVLDYRSTDLELWISQDPTRKFDIVIDGVGGKTLESAWKTVKDGGFIISIAEPAEPKRPNEGVGSGIRSLWFIYRPFGSQLKTITQLIEEGKCKPVYDSSWDFEDYEKAFARVEGGHVTGKVVLRAPSK